MPHFNTPSHKDPFIEESGNRHRTLRALNIALNKIAPQPKHPEFEEDKKEVQAMLVRFIGSRKGLTQEDLPKADELVNRIKNKYADLTL